MEPFLIPLIIGVFGSAIIGVAATVSNANKHSYKMAALAHPKLQLLEPGDWIAQPVVGFGASVRVRAAGGGKNDPARWDCTVDSVPLHKRTTMVIRKENILSFIDTKLGGYDVQVGNTAFDEAYSIHGREPDIVRGALQSQELRDAIDVLFQQFGARHFWVRSEGSMWVDAARSKMDADHVAALGEAVSHLADELGKVTDCEPVPDPGPPRAQLKAGTGASSGAPISIKS